MTNVTDVDCFTINSANQCRFSANFQLRYNLQSERAQALNLRAKIHFPAALLPFNAKLSRTQLFCTMNNNNQTMHVRRADRTCECALACCTQRASPVGCMRPSGHLVRSEGFSGLIQKVPPDWRTCKWGQFKGGGCFDEDIVKETYYWLMGKQTRFLRDSILPARRTRSYILLWHHCTRISVSPECH